MENTITSQANDLIVLATPPRLPKGRPTSLALDADNSDEKASNKLPQRSTSQLSASQLSAAQSSSQWTPYSYHDSPDTARSYPATPPTSQFIRHGQHHSRSISHSFLNRRAPSLFATLRPWIPLIMYAITSLAFVVAFAFYKAELFSYLDELALWLRADEEYGHAVLFFLIFLTTIPPIPLYSTLIVLSGYTFGAWTGAIISYFAALSGAIVVFVLSRALLHDCIDRWLNALTGIRRVVRAIEKRPKLLFLIRLAPYPYNVMNCLLAASPTLTLHTYTVCTALSLFKVIIHTYIGASIHSFKDLHAAHASSVKDSTSDIMAHFWTIFGVGLCVIILVYLSIVARRAVDEELDEAPITSRDAEETRAFLSGSDNDMESGNLSRERPMTEVPFHSQQVTRPSFSAERNSTWR